MPVLILIQEVVLEEGHATRVGSEHRTRSHLEHAASTSAGPAKAGCESYDENNRRHHQASGGHGKSVRRSRLRRAPRHGFTTCQHKPHRPRVISHLPALNVWRIVEGGNGRHATRCRRAVARSRGARSGSFDSLLGAYHLGGLDLGRVAPDRTLGWFAQILWQRAFATQGGYRPGDELNSAIGVDYDFGPLGKITEFAPVLELISSNRWRDSGPAADPPNTGYDRLVLTPGIEVGAGNVRIFADVGFPVFIDMNGDQLIARELYKLVISYMF